MDRLEQFLITKSAWFIGLGQALGVMLYVVIFATVVFNLGQHIRVDNPIFSAVTALTSFVTSTLICGSLVLGAPALLALKGQIKQAIMIMVWSAIWLIVILSGWVITLASVDWK